MKKHIILILILTFFSNHSLNSQSPDTKIKTEKKDSIKPKKKKALLPLKPERKITINTDEGTWMSLDVSPDGNTIAFDLLGDIYTLPIQGGKAKRITKGLAFDAHPKFSPDGKSLLIVPWHEVDMKDHPIKAHPRQKLYSQALINYSLQYQLYFDTF